MSPSEVRPWIALGAGVILFGVGIVTMQLAYVALGAGSIGLKGFEGAVKGSES